MRLRLADRGGASAFVWRPEVREVVEQIAMRSDTISCHLPICVNGEEDVDNIVAECPAIVRKRSRATRVIGKNVWQQLSRDRDCVSRRITAGVFQFVHENLNKAIIIRWLAAEVRLP